MDCGYQWNESNEKVCRCPHCGARLEILDTKCRTFKDKAYYSTLATQDGLQVQRVFLMNANFRKGKKAEYYSMEIARYWVDDNGKTEITALKRTLGHYADTFVLTAVWSYGETTMCTDGLPIARSIHIILPLQS